MAIIPLAVQWRVLRGILAVGRGPVWAYLTWADEMFQPFPP